MENLVLLLAPCVPHFAEELYHLLGNDGTVFDHPYPVCDETKLVRDEAEYAVQVNSKMKAKVVLSKTLSKEETEKAALALDEIVAALNGATPKKIIVIPGRLINIII